MEDAARVISITVHRNLRVCRVIDRLLSDADIEEIIEDVQIPRTYTGESLWEVAFDGNQLTVIPYSFSRLRNLQRLSLQRNVLISIQGIGNLSVLRYLPSPFFPYC